MINVVNMAATVLLALVADWGIVGVATVAVIAETVGSVLGMMLPRHIWGRTLRAGREALFDRKSLTRMIAVNRDILIRTAALSAVLLFFLAQGAHVPATRCSPQTPC